MGASAKWKNCFIFSQGIIMCVKMIHKSAFKAKPKR